MLARALVAVLALGACADAPSSPPVDPNDLDGDGIPNDADLCPRTYGDVQHDEDADGVGDACDNCPTVANPEQGDTTELDARNFPDGVGDACDRRPTLAGDEIARFFPFADPSEASAFDGTGWTIGNDQARATSTTSAQWTSRKAELGAGLSLQITIASLVWPAIDDGEVTVALDGAGESSGYRCRIVHETTGDRLVLEEIGGATASKALARIGPTSRLVLTISRQFIAPPTGDAACFLAIDGGRETRVDITTLDDQSLGTYALGARAADVALDAATVLTTPTGCITPAGTLGVCPRPPRE